MRVPDDVVLLWSDDKCVLYYRSSVGREADPHIAGVMCGGTLLWKNVIGREGPVSTTT